MSFIEIYNVETMIDNGIKITDLINLACVMTASGVAVYGINSWRREAKWKKTSDLKEELTTLLYELKDVLRDIRSPHSYVGEGATYNKDEKKHSNLAIARERYDKNKELFAKLQAKKYRAMAVFSSSIEVHFIAINRIINEIFISARRLDVQYYPKFGVGPEPTKEELDKLVAEIDKHEKIVFWMGEEDEHEKFTNQIIENFIDALNKIK